MSDILTSPPELGENTGSIVVEPAPQGPPAPPEGPRYVMARGETFSREEYHDVGWTDAQLIAAGRMSVVTVSATAPVPPIGMPAYKWIVLDDNDDIPPTGLFVGHNGTGFLIQTGVPVRVPVHVLGVLDDAIMDAPVLDLATRQIKGYRPRPRYTYKEVPAPTDA